MKELKYTNGLAVIILRERVTASEYSKETYLQVRFQFKTAVAIKRLVEELGTHLISKAEKEHLLQRKKTTDFVSLDLNLSMQDLPVGQPIWYLKTGFEMDSINNFSDENYRIHIPVTKDSLTNCLKNESFKKLYKTAHFGSCSDGYSLKEYINNRIKCKNVIK